MPYVTIEMPKLSLKVARNYVWLEKLVLTNQAGLVIPEYDGPTAQKEPIQNGVIVGLGPTAFGEGYRRGLHVLYRRAAAQEHTFLGRKLFLIFSSEIVSVKLEGPAPDHEKATGALPLSKRAPEGRSG